MDFRCRYIAYLRGLKDSGALAGVAHGKVVEAVVVVEVVQVLWWGRTARWPC